MDKHNYIFYYNDGAYIIHALTDEHYDHVVNAAGKGRNTMVVLDGFGVLYMDQVRAIVRQEDEPGENESYTPELTPEEREFYKMMKATEKLFVEEGDNE